MMPKSDPNLDFYKKKMVISNEIWLEHQINSYMCRFDIRTLWFEENHTRTTRLNGQPTKRGGPESTDVR